MSIALTSYTSFDEIRAVLGLNEDELSDDTLSLNIYESMLSLELDGIDSALATAFDTAVSAVSPTSAQSSFIQATRVFSTYAVAKMLLPSLPLLVSKDETDGKASESRFSDSPYKATMEAITNQYSMTKSQLVTAYNAVGTSSVTSTRLSLFSVVTPSVNIVTGS